MPAKRTISRKKENGIAGISEMTFLLSGKFRSFDEKLNAYKKWRELSFENRIDSLELWLKNPDLWRKIENSIGEFKI